MTRSSRHQFRDYLQDRPWSQPLSRDGQPLDTGWTPSQHQTDEGPALSRRRYLGDYFAWIRPHLWAIVGVFALALISSALILVPPYATKYVIDTVLQRPLAEHPRAMRDLHLIGAVVLVVILLAAGLDAWRGYGLAVLNARIVCRLRQRLYEHLLRLPLHELSAMKTGGLITRLSNDIDDVTGLLQMAVITPGVAAIRLLLTIAMLIYLQWKMALVASMLLPPIILVNLFWVRRLRPIHRSLRRDRSDVNARAAETFAGIRVVRAFQRENREALRFAIGQHVIVRKQLLAAVLRLVVTSAWTLIIPLCALVVIWYGGTRYLLGETTIGAIMAFHMYVFMLLHPVSSIVHSIGDTQRSLAAMERTFDTLRRPVDKPDPPDALDAPTPVRELRFDGVWFAYPEGPPVLRDINLAVRAGQTVALVGPSGSGKTTLTNLVARFYDPTAGAVLLNGVDLRRIRLKSYRSLLGVVEQDVFLFDGTVRENIAYARPDAPFDAVVAAARRANAHEFIMQLPQGYDTIIGERGYRLSGGQRQRLSIARALLADPQILILDEATSNLDTESEQLIQASLRELLAGRTTFVIAHRLSTIMHADLIVVLQAGSIVETGTHAELMARGGIYSRMVARQMALDTTAPSLWVS